MWSSKTQIYTYFTKTNVNMSRIGPAFSVSLKFPKQNTPNVKSGAFPLLGMKK
jgi:hypothetical protein